MKIGVISDTHIPLRAVCLPPIVFTAFADVELILHAGDLVDESVLIELEAIKPVKAVCGNCDPFELELKLPHSTIIELNGYRLGLTHGHQGNRNLPTPLCALSRFEQVDLVVFGHSHAPYNELVDGVRLFNPGSATDRRNQPRCSIGIIELGQTIECRHIFI